MMIRGLQDNRRAGGSRNSQAGPEPPGSMAARVQASFGRLAMMATLGVRLAAVERGRVELVMDHDDRFTQQHGFLHAGTVAAVLDSACGYAAFSVMAPEAAVLTAGYTINLLAPAGGTPVRDDRRRRQGRADAGGLPRPGNRRWRNAAVRRDAGHSERRVPASATDSTPGGSRHLWTTCLGEHLAGAFARL